MPNPSLGWPLYFCRRSIRGAKVRILPGQPFPMQDKQTIRGFASAAGVKNPDRLSFAELPYVQVLDVQSAEIAQQIMERGLSYEEAQQLVAGE